MPKQQKKYKRLRGRKRGFFKNYTLWQGPDHLLYIAGLHIVPFFRIRISEDYRRFYYKNIQAVIIQKTSWGLIYSLVFAALLALFLLPAFLSDKGATFFWIMSGLFLLGLLINLFLGPTCTCHLQTAVQIERLPSLCRIKTAQKVIAHLKPLIEASQGTLAPETLIESPLMAPPEPPTPPHIHTASQFHKHEQGTFHRLLFFLLLAGGLFSSLEFFYHHVAITLLGSAIILGTAVCVIIALVKQHDSDIKSGLKAVAWTSLGYICVCFISGYIVYFAVAIKDPEIIQNQWELTKRLSALGPWDGPWFMGLYIFSICASFTLGISGLILLKKHVNECKPSIRNPAISPDVPLPVRSR